MDRSDILKEMMSQFQTYCDNGHSEPRLLLYNDSTSPYEVDECSLIEDPADFDTVAEWNQIVSIFKEMAITHVKPSHNRLAFIDIKTIWTDDENEIFHQAVVFQDRCRDGGGETHLMHFDGHTILGVETTYVPDIALEHIFFNSCHIM